MVKESKKRIAPTAGQLGRGGWPGRRFSENVHHHTPSTSAFFLVTIDLFVSLHKVSEIIYETPLQLTNIAIATNKVSRHPSIYLQSVQRLFQWPDNRQRMDSYACSKTVTPSRISHKCQHLIDKSNLVNNLMSSSGPSTSLRISSSH